MATKKGSSAIPQIIAPTKNLPTIAERFQQLDFDEAVVCFNEVKAIMKQRVSDKFKETENRFGMLKEFASANNI